MVQNLSLYLGREAAAADGYEGAQQVVIYPSLGGVRATLTDVTRRWLTQSRDQPPVASS